MSSEVKPRMKIRVLPPRPGMNENFRVMVEGRSGMGKGATLEEALGDLLWHYFEAFGITVEHVSEEDRKAFLKELNPVWAPHKDPPL